MPRARANGVELEYEAFGPDGAEAVLLINGLGSQMTRWPVVFCEALVAHGYRAIRFDNRDVGLSTWLNGGGSYGLSDMASDAVAVLDAAGVGKAHVAGMSMGGMIGQRLALDHPQRLLSLTSIMSSTGAPETFQSSPEAAAVLESPAPDPKADLEAFLDHMVASATVISSPAFPWPEGALRERAAAELRRAFNPAGVARQMAAVRADGDRTQQLKALRLPTVVLHGADDPLIRPVGGRATAAAIPGAELRIVEGMGHDLPPGLYDIFIDAIEAAADRARAAA